MTQKTRQILSRMFISGWLLLGLHLQPIRAQFSDEPMDGLSVALALEQATIAAVERFQDSVVAISRVRKDQVGRSDGRGPERGLGLQLDPEELDYVPQFFGSGVVISADGFIVTCAHVLDDPNLFNYYVWVNQRSFPARAVGTSAKVMAADPYSDLAVLKIEESGLHAASLGNAEELKKGQFVLALGNPEAIARDGSPSVGWGMVSNLQRMAPADEATNSSTSSVESLHEFGTLIQTDAKLNLGMSGGALINLRGEMIGLTTSLVATRGQEQPAGYAIAVDALFRRVVDALRSGKLPEYGFLGIQPEDLRPDERRKGEVGARVSLVLPGWPGDLAGLKSNDLIVAVSGKSVETRSDLFRELSVLPAGVDVELTVKRNRIGVPLPDKLSLTASLSKKYVSTSRPSYAIDAPPRWRGLEVDYATAVPPELTRGVFLGGRNITPKLLVTAVSPDSVAWSAGIRRCDGITEVLGKKVESPAEFYAITDAVVDQAVGLTILRSNGRTVEVRVPVDLSMPSDPR